MIKRLIVLCVAVAGAMVGCKEEHAGTTDGVVPMDENEITLSDQQLSAAQIRTGTISRAIVNRELVLNGVIAVPPQHLITVSPPSEGFVRDIRVREGMRVRKGQVLLSLENMDFIQMQQDYLEQKSRLEFLSTEYERQKVLAREDINSGKALQQAKSNYEGTVSVVKGLEAKLKMLRIPIHKVSNGEITSRIHVYAPAEGFVTDIVEGTSHFVQATETLLRIVNVDQVLLAVQVFDIEL